MPTQHFLFYSKLLQTDVYSSDM